jgi:hypothetical protein
MGIGMAENDKRPGTGSVRGVEADQVRIPSTLAFF